MYLQQVNVHSEYLFKSMLDPDMDKQIDVIKMMVESYLKIVGKTIRDITPKYIMLLLVIHVSTCY